MSIPDGDAGRIVAVIEKASRMGSQGTDSACLFGAMLDEEKRGHELAVA